MAPFVEGSDHGKAVSERWCLHCVRIRERLVEDKPMRRAMIRNSKAQARSNDLHRCKPNS